MTKKEKKFVILSIIAIILFIGLYTYRFIYYYGIEHPKDSNQTIYPKLYEKILTSYNNKDGLYKNQDNNSYYFYGAVDNNYVLFSGKLFRIVSLDEDGNLKLITNTSQTVLANGKDYENSYTRDWLNPICENCGHFYKTINDNLLTYTTVYLDVIDNLNNSTSKKVYDDSVGLLSIYEYIKAGASSSYLVNDEDWWLSTQTSNNETWYVAKQTVDKASFNSSVSKGVRPVLTLSFETPLISGDGTIDNPYLVEETNKTALKDIFVGEKITIDNYTFKVVNKINNTLKIKLDGYIDLNRNFDYEKNIYDVEKTSSLAYYLNNNIIIDNEYLTLCDWNNGAYGVIDYDYKQSFSSSLTNSNGLLSIGDFYINETPTFLLNAKESLTSIYTINENKMIYENEITNELKISPSYCINGNIKIESGNGYNEPYTIGGVLNEA